jgi:hypothetical protein
LHLELLLLLRLAGTCMVRCETIALLLLLLLPHFRLTFCCCCCLLRLSQIFAGFNSDMALPPNPKVTRGSVLNKAQVCETRRVDYTLTFGPFESKFCGKSQVRVQHCTVYLSYYLSFVGVQAPFETSRQLQMPISLPA